MITSRSDIVTELIIFKTWPVIRQCIRHEMKAYLVNVSRKDDLQCKRLKGIAQPANCSGTRRLHNVALDPQSLVLASKESSEELSDGNKLVS